jgi:hypothetical protein
MDLVVTESGHVVTFDEWCRAGHDHALVVYSPKCEIVRDASLEQLKLADAVPRANHSFSSRHWRYGDEPTVVTDATVSFTSSWGTDATVSVHDGTLTLSGGPFKHLARLIRGDLTSLVRAGFTQHHGEVRRVCDWADETVSCTSFEDGKERVLFTTRIARASLRGRLEPALKLHHLIRAFPPCRGNCTELIDFVLEFRDGGQSYTYTLRGDGGGPPEEAASLRALMSAFKFPASGEN